MALKPINFRRIRTGSQNSNVLLHTTSFVSLSLLPLEANKTGFNLIFVSILYSWKAVYDKMRKISIKNHKLIIFN